MEIPFIAVRLAVHPLPAHTPAGPRRQWQGRSLETLDVNPTDLTGAPGLGVSFEEIYQQLESWPHLYIEPDGSFVCRSIDAEGRPWQFDGVLYDRPEGLQYVELTAQCPYKQLTPLFDAVGAQVTSLMIQILEAGLFVRQADLRRWWPPI